MFSLLLHVVAVDVRTDLFAAYSDVLSEVSDVPQKYFFGSHGAVSAVETRARARRDLLLSTIIINKPNERHLTKLFCYLEFTGQRLHPV